MMTVMLMMMNKLMTFLMMMMMMNKLMTVLMIMMLKLMTALIMMLMMIVREELVSSDDENLILMLKEDLLPCLKFMRGELDRDADDDENMTCPLL